MSKERIEKLEAMLEARTERDGKPKRGYERNVVAVKAELERLKGEDHE